jgi:hypothetical protein
MFPKNILTKIFLIFLKSYFAFLISALQVVPIWKVVLAENEDESMVNARVFYTRVASVSRAMAILGNQMLAGHPVAFRPFK